jgi:hypothetical protein
MCNRTSFNSTESQGPKGRAHNFLIIDDQEAIQDGYRKIICPVRTQHDALAEVESQLFGDVPVELDEDAFYEVDSAFQGRDAVTLVEKSLAEGGLTPWPLLTFACRRDGMGSTPSAISGKSIRKF